MAEQEFKWYVLRAISGKEAKVKEYIDTECAHSDLGNYVSQVLIPTEKYVKVTNGKKAVKERTYLPGYVLVQVNLNSEIASRLRFMPNVLGFLPNLNNPTPLRPAEVNRLLNTYDQLLEQVSEEVTVCFNAGDAVKVNEGPFQGFSGVIEEVNMEKRKLKVNVKVFGRKTPIELDFMQVEKE